MLKSGLAVSAVVLLMTFITACSDNNRDQASMIYQQYYEPMPGSIHISSITSADGEPLFFVDQGPDDGLPVLLVTGSGTSVTAALLTSHLNTLREQLNIRLISVQRGGFGERVYREDWGYDDYVEEVRTVLAHLEVDDFHIFAISGGGPYTAFLSEAMADRLRSVHLAATITGNTLVAGADTLPGSLDLLCALAGNTTPVANIKSVLGSFVLGSAEEWWAFAEDNPMLAVPGFEQAAAVDWEYTFFSGDSDLALTAASAELLRYCTEPLPDLSAIVAPVYIYQGLEDTSAEEINVDAWLASLVNSSMTTVRRYSGEGHWVQYSHLEQIYADIARPGYLVICDAQGMTRLSPAADATAMLEAGEAAGGMCVAGSPP